MHTTENPFAAEASRPMNGGQQSSVSLRPASFVVAVQNVDHSRFMILSGYTESDMVGTSIRIKFPTAINVIGSSVFLVLI